VTFTVSGDGVHTVQAQTPSGATRYLTFGIDKTAPAIVVNTPLQGATYALGEQVRASFSCTDAGSGVRTGCAGTVANGALIDTATLGTKTFTVSAATDAVGNTAPAKTVTYSVAYRKVLFSSLRDGNGGEIYSLNANGSVDRLTNNPAIDSVPMYSPDGRRILFTSSRTGNGDIYAMNTDGTGVVQLTNSLGIEALGAYSPDGKKIVYTSTKDGNVELYAMNADGTNQTRLTSNPAWDANPVFSPDGTKVAFTSNRTSNNYDIYVAPFTTSVVSGKTVYSLGAATRLTTANGIDGEATWSSAGIAFTSNRDGNAEIYTMTPTGGSQTRRTNNAGTDSTAAWSVDGKQLVFSSNRSGSAGFDVYSMTVPATGLGTAVTRLTTNAAFDGTPAW
jgi:Tol biopolymer transport system component